MKAERIAAPVPGDDGDELVREAMAAADTVVVRGDDEASDVAATIDREGSRRAIVLDERGEPAGVIDPDAVRRALSERGAPDPETMKAAVDRLEREPPDDREELAEAMRGARPGRYWCDTGMHWSNSPSCSQHSRL